MSKLRRSLRAAACAPLIAALAAGAAFAQDNGVVGPPQLKDFQLPGTRTTPPPAAPAPAATPPRTNSVRTAPPETRPTAAAPSREAPARAAPVRSAPPRRSPPPAVAPPAPQPRSQAAPPPVEMAPAGTAPAQPAPIPAPIAVEPQPQPQPQAAPPAAEAPFSFLWLLLLLPVAGIVGAFAWFRLRRRDGEDRAGASDSLGAALGAARWLDEEAETAAEPATPEAEPVATAAAEAEARAWLELEIRPDRAAATEAEAALHFDLILRNAGALPARNIRIDSRLFNASDEAEVATFLAGPIHDKSGSPHISIPPEEVLQLGASVGLRREEVREIQIQGRSIFVPALAINVAYDWDGGTVSGRTSRSWVIGRETEGSAKMGPFRLDLGPRVYRQVGGREARKVMA